MFRFYNIKWWYNIIIIIECQLGVGWRRVGSQQASSSPSTALCGPPPGTWPQLGVGWRRMLFRQFQWYTCQYMQIRAATYLYIHIHTDTYIYVRNVPDLGVTYDWLGVFSHECVRKVPDLGVTNDWLGRYIQCTYIHVSVRICKYEHVYVSICTYVYISYQWSHSLMAMIASGKGSITWLAGERFALCDDDNVRVNELDGQSVQDIREN